MKQSTSSLKLFKISERYVGTDNSGLVVAFGKLERWKLHLKEGCSQNGVTVMMMRSF